MNKCSYCGKETTEKIKEVYHLEGNTTSWESIGHNECKREAVKGDEHFTHESDGVFHFDMNDYVFVDPSFEGFGKTHAQMQKL